MARAARPKVIWTGLCLLVLIFFFVSLTILDFLPYHALIITLGLMSLLTFPLGPIVFLCLAYLNEITGESLHTGIPALNITIIWLIFYGVGYLQWFVLLPRIRRKLKTSRGR